MDGLEQLRAVLQPGAPLPGVAALLGITVEQLAVGEASFALATSHAMTNPIGSVHGGVIATLLDSALSCAVHTTLGEGEAYTTLDLQVRFVGSAPPDGRRLTARGSVVHRGRRSATAEGRVHDDAGRLVAHGSVSCLVIAAS